MFFCCFFLFFFFKQKTAYELRISDWSSDVCSSDLWIADAGTNLIGCQFVIGAGVVAGIVRKRTFPGVGDLYEDLTRVARRFPQKQRRQHRNAGISVAAQPLSPGDLLMPGDVGETHGELAVVGARHLSHRPVGDVKRLVGTHADPVEEMIVGACGRPVSLLAVAIRNQVVQPFSAQAVGGIIARKTGCGGDLLRRPQRLGPDGQSRHPAAKDVGDRTVHQSISSSRLPKVSSSRSTSMASRSCSSRTSSPRRQERRSEEHTYELQ